MSAKPYRVIFDNVRSSVTSNLLCCDDSLVEILRAIVFVSLFL